MVYDREGADELVFLDITASSDHRTIMLDVAKRTGRAVSAFDVFIHGGRTPTGKDAVAWAQEAVGRAPVIASGGRGGIANDVLVRRPLE